MHPALTRRTLLGSLATTAFVVGCKRRRTSPIPEVWDEKPAPGEAEALASLAPPWSAPTKVLVDNGAVVFWLHEQDSTAAHVRLLLNTTARHDPIDAAAVTVAAEVLRTALQRNLKARGIVVATHHGPGRLELAVHGSDAHLVDIFDQLGRVLGQPSAEALNRLRHTRARLVKRPAPADPETVATAVVTAQILGIPPHTLYATTATLRNLTDPQLTAAWAKLTDPRTSVVLVHAGRNAEEGSSTLPGLAAAWPAIGRRKTEHQATARLQSTWAGDQTDRLLASPAAPLHVFPRQSDNDASILVIGRAIATPTTQDRAMARLSQRILQEDLDARLVISGGLSMLSVVSKLPSEDPKAHIEALAAQLKAFASARQPQQRLFAAAQLWLGARVTQASLDGEDWTSLFAESIDLATDDNDVPSALARDAQAALAIESAALLQWQSTWFEPTTGQPGWHWAVGGASQPQLQGIEGLAPQVRVAVG